VFELPDITPQEFQVPPFDNDDCYRGISPLRNSRRRFFFFQLKNFVPDEMRLTVASLASAQSRKWILPSLWLILVIWFLGRTLNHSKYAEKLNIFSGNGTFDGTKAQLYEYYSSLRHSKNKTDSHLEEKWMTVNISTSNKVAVIIETRRSGGIVPLVLHFSAVLGPDWPSESSCS
jgi:hypothetical protein